MANNNERFRNQDEDFQQVSELEGEITAHARARYNRGEIPEGRRYEPLPDDETEALKEIERREHQSILEAKQDLSERRSING